MRTRVGLEKGGKTEREGRDWLWRFEGWLWRKGGREWRKEEREEGCG
ncbi:uncharacterized protein G2W53_015026 [Senna tora]|uniref:Uncharacterized protein n=1 Tax=Senna tora TaxID=362788 RepID=A0A834WVA6_9FABA|nr:uncharacterized protein G2W53_015026 [Senna tora]